MRCDGGLKLCRASFVGMAPQVTHRHLLRDADIGKIQRVKYMTKI